jgi:hypothetical protein
MNEADQTHAFANAIEKVISHYRDEFDLTYAAIIGVLTIQTQALCAEALEDEEDEDDDDLEEV